MQVPLWAEYRLAVQLQPVSNAVVTDASNGVQQVAVHIFGVDQGTCPPGTYLKPRPGCASGDNVLHPSLSTRPSTSMAVCPLKSTFISG